MCSILITSSVIRVDKAALEEDIIKPDIDNDEVGLAKVAIGEVNLEA
jgi:hypothetical protein